MGLCDNNNSLYSEAKTTSVSSRKSIISNYITNGFFELNDKLDNEPNLIAQSFTSENATIDSLSVVGNADNPDTLPLKKVTVPTSRPSMLQWMSPTTNQGQVKIC